MDADVFLSDVASGADPAGWLLAGMVGTRELIDLIAWPLTGTPPATFAHLNGEARIAAYGAGDRARLRGSAG